MKEVSSRTQSSFNGCEALPGDFRAGTTSRGAAALSVHPPHSPLFYHLSCRKCFPVCYLILQNRNEARCVLLRKMQSSPRSVGWPLGTAAMRGGRCSSPHALSPSPRQPAGALKGPRGTCN